MPHPLNLSAGALETLAPSQIAFLHSLPKAELHAHLNGCIPIPTLLSLASNSDLSINASASLEPLTNLAHGVHLATIDDFFNLFPTIYSLTSTPANLAIATRAVLAQFISSSDDTTNENYVELRSTPRETAAMTRREYVETVLDEVERYREGRAGLIVSLDRRMTEEVLGQCVDVAVRLKEEGRRVVGLDLCGNPLVGDAKVLAKYLDRARAAGLGLTVHVAETERNTAEDTLALLSAHPHRLGHATFLDEAAKEIVLREKMVIEICLSSNLLCKTVDSIDAHHIRYYLERNHPIVICTDDTLPFRTSLLAEYALLLAPPPHGLGLSEAEVKRVAEMGMEARFLPAAPLDSHR